MAAKEAAPELPRGWLVDEFTEADWDAPGGARGRVAAHEPQEVRRGDVARLHERGYRVMLYHGERP
jgi:hypothetical protein